jgi:hypothetical protein
VEKRGRERIRMMADGGDPLGSETGWEMKGRRAGWAVLGRKAWWAGWVCCERRDWGVVENFGN